eukprot:TRINITY_DN62839_c0_g1_i1.p1 TRINITY_DN62839_c0_g1~~TRINITY_DN62839_c0_g1_i1.p1  ORF type:complete len:210 (+),score=39.52 TRINITY_DN62839_c0_g1_i1:107-736(+)
MSVIDKLMAMFQHYDSVGTGSLPRREFYQALQLLDPNTWTDSTLDCLLQEMGDIADSSVPYERFVKWVMSMPPRAQLSEGDANLMSSIRLASSQGPMTLSALQELHHAPPLSEEDLLRLTLEAEDAPTELPTRRPSSCPTEIFEEPLFPSPEPKEDLLTTIRSGEEDLLATLLMATSQGAETLASPLAMSSASLAMAEEDILSAALVQS